MQTTKLLNAVVFTLLSTAGAEAATTQYVVTDLGLNVPAGTTGAYADGINDLGQVVGGIADANGFYTAALFQNGTVTDLGTLGGDTSGANAINNSGQIVGVADLPNFNGSSAFYYNATTGGPLTDLGTLPLGGNFHESSANAINNAGVIVGTSTNASGTGRATQFYANASAPTDLGLADPTQGSAAYAVSNTGVIAGSSFINGTTPAQHAATFNGGVTFEPNITTNVGNSSFINAVNDSGVAVGYGQIGLYGTNNALVYSNGGVQNIGTLGDPTTGNGYAQAINNLGQIVGYSQFTDASGNYDTDAFIYQNGALTDLNSLIAAGSPDDFTALQYALGINSTGSIVGYGLLTDGDYGAFLLTPTAVPEPVGMTLAVLALGGLFVVRPQRKTLAMVRAQIS